MIARSAFLNPHHHRFRWARSPRRHSRRPLSIQSRQPRAGSSKPAYGPRPRPSAAASLHSAAQGRRSAPPTKPTRKPLLHPPLDGLTPELPPASVLLGPASTSLTPGSRELHLRDWGVWGVGVQAQQLWVGMGIQSSLSRVEGVGRVQILWIDTDCGGLLRIWGFQIEGLRFPARRLSSGLHK